MIGAADGKITACIPNPAVDSILLEQVHSWIEAGVTIDDAIERLRAQTVPPGYIVHSWIEGNGCFIAIVTP